MKATDCSDPVVDEIRRIRRQIAARHGNDPKRLVEHYMEYQKQFADRLVPPPDASGATLRS
ncbi:MAG TPA: hypothetical protein VF092_17450 [Longimicrobium sp.]